MRDKKNVNTPACRPHTKIQSLRQKTDVLKAMMDIRSAKEVFVTAKEGLKSAEENYAMANDRYRTNTGTITELIDAQTKLTGPKSG